MSIEYMIHATDITKDVISVIFSAIKSEFPSATPGIDNSLWIPSSYPDWIDFSIEEVSDGLFIVSNLNGPPKNKIFDIVKMIFLKFHIEYSIEEI